MQHSWLSAGRTTFTDYLLISPIDQASGKSERHIATYVDTAKNSGR